LSIGALAWGVLSSRTVWLLGLSYLCNSAVRSGLVGPTAFRAFVAEALAPAAGYSGGGEAAKAAAAAFVDRAQTSANLWFEVGGAAGGFLAGLASDRLFNGRRGPVMALSALLLCPLLLLLAAPRALFALLPAPAPAGGAAGEGVEEGAAAARVALVSALYCGLGLFAFPPHVLNGLASRELAPPALLSTAGGFTKALGQLGSALTDLYIARLVAGLGAGAEGAGAGAVAGAGAGAGWPPALRLLALLSALSGAFCLPLWGALAAAPAGEAVAANAKAKAAPAAALRAGGGAAPAGASA